MAKRVLVVDDHDAWRRHIRALLRTTGTWEIAGEAADGTEAVPAAERYAPDLILLDVELPGLNGIEVARRILGRAPETKILFVSNHRSWDVAEAAFGTGARGFVLKTNASDELLPAMNVVAGGRRFISARFGGAVVAGPREPAGELRRHDVAFYSQPSFILDDFARFAEVALNDGKAVIGLTVVARRDDLYRQLQDRLDIDLAVRQGRYTWLDAEAVIAETLLDGWPDEARFWKTATSLVIPAARRSRRDPPRVALFGEGCGELLRAGKPQAAIRLEQFWEELSLSFNLDVLCTYPISPPRADEDSETFQRLIAAHTSVITR